MDRATVHEVVAGYATAKNGGDLDTAMKVWADDSTFTAVPLGLTFEGRDAVRLQFQLLLDAFSDYDGVVEGWAFDDGGGCAVRWRWTGTLDGQFLGLGPTGRRVDVPVVSWFTVRDELIVSETVLFDLATLCDQAGIELAAVRALFVPQGVGG